MCVLWMIGVHKWATVHYNGIWSRGIMVRFTDRLSQLNGNYTTMTLKGVRLTVLVYALVVLYGIGVY